MPERRYDDKEMAEIFRAAAEGPQLPVPHPELPLEEGRTLAELQAIGQEVGISPAAVAQAAQALEVRRSPAARTLFGLPIGVARTVNLNRRLDDEEWERLVVQLREVFNARGTLRSDGSLRQWTNGNLQVLLEPTGSGDRLRFRTVHGGARTSIAAGSAMLGVSGLAVLSGILAGNLGGSVSEIVFLTIAGLGLLANGALRLPRWARLRARQMESVAAQVAAGPERTISPPSET